MLFSRWTSAALAMAIQASALLGTSTLTTGRGRSPLGFVSQPASATRAVKAKLMRAFAKRGAPRFRIRTLTTMIGTANAFN